MRDLKNLLCSPTDQELGQQWQFAGLNLKPVTMRCVWNLLWDLPLGPAELTDFGVASDDHYRALQSVVRHGGEEVGSGVKKEAVVRAKVRRLVVELDQAYGNGPAITALVYKYAPAWQGLTFETPWDVIAEGRDEVEVPF